jgi:hypothetical protein
MVPNQVVTGSPSQPTTAGSQMVRAVAPSDGLSQAYIYPVGYFPTQNQNEWVRAYAIGYPNGSAPAISATQPPPPPAAGYYLPPAPTGPQMFYPAPVPPQYPYQAPQQELNAPEESEEPAAAPAPRKRFPILSRIFGWNKDPKPATDDAAQADCNCDRAPAPVAAFNPYALPPGYMAIAPAPAPMPNLNVPLDITSPRMDPRNFPQGGNGVNRVSAEGIYEAPQR